MPILHLVFTSHVSYFLGADLKSSEGVMNSGARKSGFAN